MGVRAPLPAFRGALRAPQHPAGPSPQPGAAPLSTAQREMAAAARPPGPVPVSPVPPGLLTVKRSRASGRLKSGGDMVGLRPAALRDDAMAAGRPLALRAGR